MSKPVLHYEHVHVRYANGVSAVRGVSFSLHPGECLALVGESGCGKTTMARAALGLLPATASLHGSIRLGDDEIVGATPEMICRLRGLVVGFVAQNPFEAYNPLDQIEAHVAEAWRAHNQTPPRGLIGSALERLGIAEAPRQMRRYPHQWSGGMLQRATIAAAAAHQPLVIIADEPTSALDADRADATLAALRATGAAVLLVSHDIGVVSRHADRVAVCYAGRVVEIGHSAEVLAQPRHPYTRGLLAATPRATRGLPMPLTGTPPSLNAPILGCAFAPRCAFALPACEYQDPPLIDGVACPVLNPNNGASEMHSQNLPAEPKAAPMIKRATSSAPVVEARRVARYYGRGPRVVEAVRAASLVVQRGEIVGVSGPSGCGKSTLLRLLATIETPSIGEVLLDGTLASRGGTHRLLNPLARNGFIMPIFQDPLGSLDARWPVWRSVAEPLTAPHRNERPGMNRRREIARERLAAVGLAHIDLDARPRELSIGQCQRVAIARALLATPGLIIADEPTSALDASVAAAILRLLAATAHSGTAMVIVSHDRPLLDILCDRVLTMRDGVLETS
ncbi:MAG: ATP-binding cassette domain-containing protein [Chloroflexales bacterium]|nr:ATP-binding cassette domain-containing protein [Chloroflexales bacterium]